MLQNQDNVVAMIGDGANDSFAIKQVKKKKKIRLN
jgi:magnesium-transporting ATPase (P-type)